MQNPITRPLRANRWMSALVCALWALSPSAHADDDMWPCEVALCLANPKGPTALAECQPAIKKAWKAWAKGKHVPPCKKKSAEGQDQGALTKQEGLIEERAADPVQNCPSAFSYYATRGKTKHCAFTGVTDQYINGQLWGRIWYGGPGGEPFVEHLVDDPQNPRPPETLPATWAPVKQQIQAKADLSLQMFNQWKISQQVANQATQVANQATQHANAYAAELAAIEAALPSQIESATLAIQEAEAALEAFYPKLVAAEELAKKPGATPEDVAKYQQALAQANTFLQQKQGAVDFLNSRIALQAKLPEMHVKAQELATIASEKQAIANEKQAIAQQDKAAADAAENAAQPLPLYG